jgi:P4 family phage/plasmid primase-like protien
MAREEGLMRDEDTTTPPGGREVIDIASRRPDHRHGSGKHAAVGGAGGAPPESPTPAPERLLIHPSDLKLADHLRDRFATAGPLTVFADGRFWQWAGTHYREVPEHETIAWVEPFDGIPAGPQSVLKLNRGKIHGILAVLKDRLAAPRYFDDAPDGINVRNGFVSFDGRGRPHLTAHAPMQKQRHVIDASWDPGRTPDHPLLRTLVSGCFRDDPDARGKVIALMEIAGATLAGLGTRVREPKAVVLIGDGANGKSQVLDALIGLVPAAAVSSIPITDFHREYHRFQLVGKMLNIAAELAAGNAVASDRFKSIVTGDAVTARDIRCSPISFRPKALHAFATNEMPDFAGGVGPAVMRRLLLIRFDRRVPELERVAAIGQRIAREERDALVYFAIRGASRLLRRGDYRVPASAHAMLLEWARDSDPVLGFLDDDRAVTAVAGERVPTFDLYDRFKVWCAEQGIRRTPAVKTFVQRVVAVGRGVHRGRTNDQRHLVGLKLTE